jgi:hypothetical protein
MVIDYGQARWPTYVLWRDLGSHFSIPPDEQLADYFHDRRPISAAARDPSDLHGSVVMPFAQEG